MAQGAIGVVPWWLATALMLGCVGEPGVSRARAKLLEAGGGPPDFRACLAGLLPGGAAPQVDWPAVAAATRAIQRSQPSDACSRSRDLALLSAAAGDLEAAVSQLDSAGPAGGEPWCEAERSAYLAELGERHENPGALLEAVEAAQRALGAAPDLTVAGCNRAVALERLALHREARRAWTRLRDEDSRAPLATLAEGRIAALAQRSPAERWSALAARLERDPGSVDLAELGEAARALPGAARRLELEVLLPEAAGRALRGDAAGAERYLVAAESLAHAAPGIDPTPSRAAAEVRGRIASGQEDRVFLDGVVAYGRGAHLRRDESYHEAAAALAEAVEGLSRLPEGAFVAWAGHAGAVARWYAAPSGRVSEAVDWEALLQLAPADLPALRAHYSWSAGVAADLRGDLPRALQHFDAAVAAFAQLGETEHEARVRALRAFVLFDLGRDREAGTDLLLALRGRDRIASDVTLELVLDAWIRLIVSIRWPQLVDLYYEELLELARTAERPSLTTQALLLRGERPGTPSEARIRHLEAALVTARAIEDPGERRRKEALIEAALAAVAVETDPASALESATKALDGLDARGLEPLRLPVLRSQARAYLRLNRPDRAESTLLGAIAALEQALARTGSVEERMRTLGEARDVFEDLAALRLAGARGANGAFEAIELGRATSLLSRAAEAAPAVEWQEVDPVRLASRLSPAHDIVEFAFVGDRLVIWHLSRGVVRSALVRSDRARVQASAERLAADLAADRQGASALAAELGDLLLGPLRGWLAPAATLTIVPDPALAAIPWSALADPVTGRPLVASRPVRVAPSARWAVGADDGSDPGSPVRSARGVGGARFSRELFPLLVSLPASAAEAESVAALYPSSELFLGERATIAAALREPLPRALHLAVHGLAPAEAPERAALVMAPDAAHPAGLLAAPDIAQRRLAGLDLVVLSACASAGGPSYGPEGILSLTTAFLAAGVPAVVATYWPVGDVATQELMVAFHRGVTAGLAPSEALRQAQLAALQTYASRPSIWAGFAMWGVR
jgi:CHAT domain-containing protein